MPASFPSRELRALAPAVTAALAAILLGALVLHLLPALELSLFAAGAARLAGLFTGTPVVRIAEGWLLPHPVFPVAVTAACSATDYYLMVAALITWQRARRGRSPAPALLVGLAAALPLTLFVNSLRVVTVTAAHRWLIPLLPSAYDAFLHLLAGVAVFLPALIALNLLLEIHGRSRSPAASA